MTQILRAHGVKHMTLDAGREFGNSTTFNGYLQQDNINVMESDNDIDDVHQCLMKVMILMTAMLMMTLL